jgi:hypothetical protein
MVINENIPQICMFNTGTKRPCVRNVQMHTEDATYSGVALRQSKEPCLGPTSSMLLRPKLNEGSRELRQASHAGVIIFLTRGFIL